jgi:hypothetical protein
MGLSRRWLAAGVLVAVVAVGAIVAVRWVRSDREPPTGATVSFGMRRITFRMPRDWPRESCSYSYTDCMGVRTPHGTKMVITVSLSTPEPLPSPPDDPFCCARVDIDYSKTPGWHRFTVDGTTFGRGRYAATVNPTREDGSVWPPARWRRRHH